MFCSGYTVSSFIFPFKIQTAFKVCILWLLYIYRLLIFRKSLLFTVLSKKLTYSYSTQQYCHLEFLFKFFNKSVNRRDFLKISNLYPKNTSTLVLHMYIFPIQNLGQKGFSIFEWTSMVAVLN